MIKTINRLKRQYPCTNKRLKSLSDTHYHSDKKAVVLLNKIIQYKHVSNLYAKKHCFFSKQPNEFHASLHYHIMYLEIYSIQFSRSNIKIS